MELLKCALQMIFDYFTTPECLFALLPLVLITLVICCGSYLMRLFGHIFRR